MDIQSAILQGGGIDAIAKQLGVPPSLAQAGASALLPAVIGGFKKNAQTQPAGLDGLVGMLGGLGGGGLFDNVVSDQPTDVSTGNNILGEIFGSKDVSRAVATQAGAQAGVDPGLLKKMLPVLSMLVAGYLANQGGAQSGPTPNAAPEQGGLLGGLLGGAIGRRARLAPRPGRGRQSARRSDRDGGKVYEPLN